MKKLFLVLFLATGMVNLQASQQNERAFNELYQNLQFITRNESLSNLFSQYENDHSPNKYKPLYDAIATMNSYLQKQIDQSKDFSLNELTTLEQQILKTKQFYNDLRSKDLHKEELAVLLVLSNVDVQEILDNNIDSLASMLNTVQKHIDTLEWDFPSDSRSKDHKQALSDYEARLRDYIHKHPNDYEKFTDVTNNESKFFPKKLNDVLRERAIQQHLAKVRDEDIAELNKKAANLKAASEKSAYDVEMGAL